MRKSPQTISNDLMLQKKQVTPFKLSFNQITITIALCWWTQIDQFKLIRKSKRIYGSKQQRKKIDTEELHDSVDVKCDLCVHLQHTGVSEMYALANDVYCVVTDNLVIAISHSNNTR